MSLTLIRNVHRNVRLFRQLPITQNFRNYSSESKNDQNQIKDLTTAKDAHQKYSRANVSQYFFNRLFQYIANYDQVLEKQFPKAMKTYRDIKIGVKDFYMDMKMYFKINSIANSKGMKALTRKEMELYNQMPKDMLKVAPVLIIATLPFMNYVIFPLAFMYPRHMLTSHFWSLQQRVEFQELFLKERTAHNKKIFRKLQENLGATNRSPYHKEFNYVLGLLGSGTHPTAEEILKVKDIFNTYPYALKNLSSSHLTYLCKLHGIHSLYLKRVRLSEHCYTMYNMDYAIKLEGGVHNLPIDGLKRACYLRGLNPINLSNEEMIEWLREWLKVTLEIKTENGFTRFVETGRIARISRGRYKGKLVAIVDVVDQNRVLIDGPLSRVPRQQYPVSHLHLTKFVVKFPFTAPTRIVKKALEDYNLKEKWSQTLWAERAKAKRLRSNLTDFERFKVRLAKRSKNRMIEPVFDKLKKAASKSGLLYGKPVKGTKPLPPKKPKTDGAKKKKKVVKKKAGTTAKKPAKK